MGGRLEIFDYWYGSKVSQRETKCLLTHLCLSKALDLGLFSKHLTSVAADATVRAAPYAGSLIQHVGYSGHEWSGT